MYRVSILVPIFKAEKYIEKCARSLFEQTYPDLEFVFVDDCSPDASMDVLFRVLEDYPNRKEQTKIIHNERNRGAAASKNRAVDNATGEFVCFVDSDDWMDLNAIELLIHRQMETGVDVVWGQMVIHNRKEIVKLEEPKYKDKQDWIMSYIGADGGGAMLSNSRRIFHRDLLESHSIRMAEGYNFSEDQYFMNQVAYYANGFSIVEDNVYHYNKNNEDSLTNNHEGEKQFVNIYRQIIGNYQRIVSFFSDKEKAYYKRAGIAMMMYLVKVADLALCRSSKDGFYLAVNQIKSADPDFWYVIGWNRNKVWRCLHGNYYYRKYMPVLKKLFRK